MTILELFAGKPLSMVVEDSISKVMENEVEGRLQ
jgi:hypothetical protein